MLFQEKQFKCKDGKKNRLKKKDEKCTMPTLIKRKLASNINIRQS